MEKRIGNHRAEPLLRLIQVLEDSLGMQAEKIMEPMQPGDVQATWADIDDLEEAVGFSPSTPLAEGLAKFVAWYDGWKSG